MTYLILTKPIPVRKFEGVTLASDAQGLVQDGIYIGAKTIVATSPQSMRFVRDNFEKLAITEIVGYIPMILPTNANEFVHNFMQVVSRAMASKDMCFDISASSDGNVGKFISTHESNGDNALRFLRTMPWEGEAHFVDELPSLVLYSDEHQRALVLPRLYTGVSGFAQDKVFPNLIVPRKDLDSILR